jgi:hypothetical protein
MAPERGPRSREKSTSPELMRKLMESFGSGKWGYNRYFVGNKGEFEMVMRNIEGDGEFEYSDLSSAYDDVPNRVAVTYFGRTNMESRELFQRIIETGKNGEDRIENHIIVPLGNKYSVEWHGVHYGPDGKMDSDLKVKGLPKKIDVDLTAEALIKQVIEGDFRKPRLIRPKKK